MPRFDADPLDVVRLGLSQALNSDLPLWRRGLSLFAAVFVGIITILLVLVALWLAWFSWTSLIGTLGR